MRKIQIKNLRSLQDTQEIEIKKINILVGNNSSGKSTFLRIFPLFKQSFNKKINGPILWCGDDDDYVDFGSFQEALNYHTGDKCIKIMFECMIDLMSNYMRYSPFERSEHKEEIRIEFSIMHCEQSGYDYISEIQYRFRKSLIAVSFSENGIIDKFCFDGEEITLETDGERYFSYFYEEPLFDISLFPVKQAAESVLARFLNIDSNADNTRRMIDECISSIYYVKVLGKKEVLKECGSIIRKKIKEAYENNEKKQIEKWILIYYLPTHFSSISSYLKAYFGKVYYIAPVRATAERYYRLRNAAVKEVDCRGKNLPVFLNSLSERQFSQFQEWTRANLGFEVDKTTSEGHVSLKIKKNGQSKAVNLSDTGFGYSQILPIITQLWYIAIQVEDQKDVPFWIGEIDVPVTIVIEQPELHLHPGLQAKLIDIITKVAKQGNVHFIIETHSETMINRLGSIISKEEISNEDIGIVIFEKESDDDSTNVKQGGYDEDGYLENWPIGFFEPEEV